MRNPKFKQVRPNYRKNVLEVILQEGKRIVKFDLPFGAFSSKTISSKNRFQSISIDKELGNQGLSFVLEDGTQGDFPADFVLYYCDPTYSWSPINQLKKAIKEKLDASQLSIRVLADVLNTSPSQVTRLFKENQAAKQVLQLFQIAELSGYHVEFHLKKKVS